MSIKYALRTLGLACLTAAALSAQAPAGANEANLKALVDAARKDLKAEKQSMIDQAMKLDAGDKSKFWGIYTGFQKELDAIWDTRIANIKKYADSYQSMTDPVADQLASSALNNETQLTALKKKYHAQFKAALGSKIAARWLQAETTLGNVMMLQLLSQVPLLE